MIRSAHESPWIPLRLETIRQGGQGKRKAAQAVPEANRWGMGARKVRKFALAAGILFFQFLFGSFTSGKSSRLNICSFPPASGSHSILACLFVFLLSSPSYFSAASQLFPGVVVLSWRGFVYFLSSLDPSVGLPHHTLTAFLKCSELNALFFIDSVLLYYTFYYWIFTSNFLVYFSLLGLTFFCYYMVHLGCNE